MIAVVFILILVGVFFGMSLFGVGSAGQIPVLPVLLVLAVFCAFFAAGIYIGAALGVLGILAGFAFSDLSLIHI